MSFSVGALRGGPERRGVVDHRLARRMLINQVRVGRIAREQVCDAHPELIRAAKNVGTQTKTRCPICEESDLKLITYVFGSRLPAHGRCVSTAKEMRRLGSQDRRAHRVRGGGVRRVSLAPLAPRAARRRQFLTLPSGMIRL